jgi:hypothetical protein
MEVELLRASSLLTGRGVAEKFVFGSSHHELVHIKRSSRIGKLMGVHGLSLSKRQLITSNVADILDVIVRNILDGPILENEPKLTFNKFIP